MSIENDNETQHWNFSYTVDTWNTIDIYTSYLEGFILTPVAIMGIVGKCILSHDSNLKIGIMGQIGSVFGGYD